MLQIHTLCNKLLITSRFYQISKFLKCNVNMTKSTPLSQIPRSEIKQQIDSNSTNTDVSPPPPNHSVVINDDKDVNIEEVLQHEKMTNNNILSLQQQIESLKSEIEKKNSTVNHNKISVDVPTDVQTAPSIINKDSLQGILFHLKNLNYTNIVVTFILVIVIYSDYIDNLLISKLGETKYAISIPYIKAIVIAFIVSLLYKL